MADQPSDKNQLTEHVDTVGSLEELFSRDPNNMTDEDVDKIVAKLRSERGHFLQAEREASNKVKPTKDKAVASVTGGAKPKAATAPKSTGPKTALGPINLEMLGLGTGPKLL